MRLKKLILAVIIFLSGCSTVELVPQIVPFTILPMPELPRLTEAQQNAIELETFLILVERDTILVEHIKTINALIKVHNSH